MPSTYQRSIIKGLSWETISFIITTWAVYLIYGNIELSLLFSFGLSLVKLVLFFVHERLWKQTRWGKVPYNG
ncbi:MAG: DUF2061 domain-containing protein [Nanoarchaeota archaeon]|nr:DUF2061 domain-containing protein [Nanoarchaeota archaeon]